MKITNREQAKERIITAATKLFAHKNFEAVSIREICKEAEINISMISYYFGGKQELYNAIIENLIEKQTKYVSKFLDLKTEPKALKKKEQINLLFKSLDIFIDFFYSNVSNDLILLLLKEQQNQKYIPKSPALEYFGKLVANVFGLKETSKEAIYQTLFIISQINSPRIFPAFSLRLLGQDTFMQEDIKIIRNNIKLYINVMLKEKGIV